MAKKHVWDVKYVAGNPAMVKKVITAADSPYLRSKALEAANCVAENGGGWRVWVEHVTTGERIFESAAEINHKAASVP